VHLNEQRLHTHWQQRVFTKLLGLQYKVVYKKGVENQAADALSRCQPSEQVNAVSTVTPAWLLELQQQYDSDPQAQDILAKLSISSSAVPNFSLHQGIIRYNGKIWLGSYKPLQSKIFAALHASAIGGHSGSPATYHRIKHLFYWPSMKSDILLWVQSYATCQHAKPDQARYPGLLQHLPVPSAAWEVVSMDFIEGLPKSDSANAILVVVDKFTKYIHFVPLHHPFTAASVAKLFMDNVYRLHSLPSAIVSDRDRVFTSNFWQSMFKLTGTKLSLNTAYHPQTDGQTERVNQCLETYLRCFVHACPTKWIQWLSLAEFWYNSSFHSSLGRSPFEVLYGHAPRHFGLSAESVGADILALNQWLSERAVM
jgi:hypothetical protein